MSRTKRTAQTAGLANGGEPKRFQKADFDKLVEISKPDVSDLQVQILNGNLCDATKITEGSLLFRPAKIIVLKNPTGNAVGVRNQDMYASGKELCDWNLDRSLIASQCISPDQYTEIKPVSKTELARLINEDVGDCVCRVEFYKQPDVSEMAKLIREGSQIIENLEVSEAEKTKMFKKLYERSQKGEYRIMRGYILRSTDMETQENETGMIKFIDADLLGQMQFAQRLLNTRTIEALTFKLTRYVLK